MDVLIIKLGALGDVLRTTFVAKGIKEKYLQSEITWLTKENAKEILTNNPYVDAILIWEQRNLLLNREFDWILQLDDEVEVCEFAVQIKTKRLQGAYLQENKRTYTRDIEAWFGMGLLRAEERGGKAEADRLKAANRKTFQEIYAEMFGIKECKDKKPVLKLTLEEFNNKQNIAEKAGIEKQNTVIGINPGAGIRWELKMLSIENTAAICNTLAQNPNNKIFILGGLDEAERNKKIKALCPNEHIMYIEPVASIRTFASIINVCNIIITADSLALHIAHALEKQVIAFFGPTSPWEIEMFGKGTKIFKESDCLCCYKKTTDKTSSCIERIEPHDIITPTQEMITSIEQKRGVK